MATPAHNLRDMYRATVVPAMVKEFSYRNQHQVPRLVKVVLNVGLSASRQDPKLAEVVRQTLSRISGQRAVATRAKKSISNFKIRQGQTVGAMVTLRGERMWSFLTRLVRVALPRVRDFRGLPARSLDAHGNLSIAFREHIVFPEIRSDEIETLHGLEVAVVTTARTRQEGAKLFQLLGFPFAD